jgi:hypothetical protein
MQHRYVGDVGDFGKYALLNALASSGFRLGIIWYLNEYEESNSDGKFISFDHLNTLDSQLFEKLRLIRTVKRHLSQINSGGVLPADTVFFDGALPRPKRPCYTPDERDSEQKHRGKWFDDAFDAMSAAQLVFLDPDNGIAPNGLGTHSTRACKYAFECEVKKIVASGRSVIVYQHQNRNGTLEQQVERSMQRFADVVTGAFGITFHAYAVRSYIILPASSIHKERLSSCCNRFLENGWNRVFRVLGALPA